MILDITFEENSQTFEAEFSEQNNSLEVEFGDVQTIPGKNGADGKSAYEVAIDNGFTGTETEWLESLHGKDGIDGKNGADGKDGYTPQKGIDYFDGADGKDGENGQDGKDGQDGYTPQKGIDYYDGDKGDKGDPFTYDDFTPEQLASLKGEKGDPGNDGYTPQKGIDYYDGAKGDPGDDGYTPQKGVDYFTPAEIAEIEQNAANKVDLSNVVNKNEVKTINGQSIIGTGDIETSGGGGGSTHKNIVVSPTSVFASANRGGSATSYNTFTTDSARIITFVEKRQYLIGNPYSRGDFLNLYVDDKNRLSLCIKTYTCKLENIVNGVVKNTVTLFTASTDTIFKKIHYAISLLYRFDFNRNKFELYVYNGTVVEKAFEQDLSEWDLSALVNFRLKTSFAWNSGHTATIFVSLNRYVDIEYYLTTPLEYSIQNTLVTQSAPTLTGFTPTALRLGGTITETISPTHKIANINQASESYFALGGTHPNFTKAKDTWIVTKFKCTNIEGFAIKCSTVIGVGMIVSEDGEILYVDGPSLKNQYPNNRASSFNPEEGVWYYFIALGQGTNDGNYLATYPARVLGSCTIEAEALHISHCNENNLCCANYNGEYFTGSLAFNAENVAFDVVDPSKGNIAYPKYSIKADANGNIFMYNGTVWKQINVS